MTDTTRAADVAREYDALQGLSLVIMGAACLLCSLLGQPAVWLALGGAASGSAPLWYQRRFGTVKPSPDRTAWSVLGVIIAVLLVLGGFVLDRHLQGPVLLTLLAVSLSLGLGQYLLLRRTGLTAVHLAVYALVAVAAAGPSVGWGLGEDRLLYILAVSGVAFVVVGLVDHRRLVRAFAPLGEDGQVPHRGR